MELETGWIGGRADGVGEFGRVWLVCVQVWCPWEFVHSFSRMVKVVRSKSGSRSRCQGPGQGVGADAGRCWVWSKKSKVRREVKEEWTTRESNADAE